jgi:hypothetical protein
VIDYIFTTKVVFSVIVLSWGITSVLNQWRKQHDPEAVGNLILKIGDIERLIKTDNRKDKDCFLKLLSTLESDITNTETMNKDRFRIYDSLIKDVLKKYNSKDE